MFICNANTIKPLIYNVLRLSCSLGQALTPFERAAKKRYTTNIQQLHYIA